MPHWPTRLAKHNRKPRIGQPSRTPRNCSLIMDERKFSNGSGQASPTESSPASGSGSLTESSRSGVEPIGAGTRESSSGSALLGLGRPNNTAHQARRTTQQTTANKYAPASLRMTDQT